MEGSTKSLKCASRFDWQLCAKQMSQEWTVERVRAAGLCMGCGTCAGVCPADSIVIERDREGNYVPIVDDLKCTNCMLCIRVCPGHRVDLSTLNQRFIGKDAHSPLGVYAACYAGYSTNKEIRWKSSSGGVVTQLLVLALKNNLIDGALVSRMNMENPLESQTIVARTTDDVVAAIGSKYCPVDTNTRLKDVSKLNGKFAIVGLPCHIYGVRRAEMLDHELRKKVVLHIGLFCSGTSSYLATELLLSRAGVSKAHVVSMGYRGKGWPGEIWAKLRDDREISLSRPYSRYWDCISQFFTPVRCLLCPDATAELADLSVGDAWLPELRNESVGMSLVIPRTTGGESILSLAISKREIVLIPISAHKVELAQAGTLKQKKKALGSSIRVYGALGRAVPTVIPFPISSGIFPYVFSLIRCASVWFGSRPSFRHLLQYLPYTLLRTYYRICLLLSLLC
jgi:coenzyme F420 hydrogenase subunit beta